MKKIRICLLTSVCMLCLAGCNSQMTEDITGQKASPAESGETAGDELSEFTIDFVSGRINITEYKSRYGDEIKEVKESDFENLSFQDCEMMPLGDFEKVGIYRLYSDDIGVDESIECVKNWLEKIGCGDTDLEKELRDASGQYERDESREYPYDYVGVYDHYPEFDSGCGFFINTDRCYIQMGKDGIYSMSDGSIANYLDSGKIPAMDALGVSEENIVDKGSVSEKSGDVWKLADGKMSVGDAAEVVKNYFEAGTPRKMASGVSVDVPEVEVFELNGKYGYAFAVRRIYKGVPFAYADTGGRSYYSAEYSVTGDMKTAYIINHDTVGAFTGYSEATLLEGLMEEQTEILGLKDAVSLLNDFFAAKVKLEADKAELAYCICRYDENERQIAYPCWGFEGTNATNEQKMRAFVNVLSGDVYYYAYNER